MAKIYGMKNREFKPESQEKEMFEALLKLPDQYRVIHSYTSRSLYSGRLDDSEADFLVFHPKFGFLIIEAKAGRVTRDGSGQWFYGNGEPMSHDPFDQAFSNLYKISKRDNLPYELQSSNWIRDNLPKAKFIPAVWLPSYTAAEIKSIIYGPGIIQDLILSKDDLDNPTPRIESIMAKYQRIHVNYHIEEILTAGGYTHQLGEVESVRLFEQAICPALGMAATMNENATEFIQLLKEQKLALDFLAEQKTAVISGAGGTGKTLLAIERCKRITVQGDQALFLCYNSNLRDELERKWGKELPTVKFYTIDGFACMLCKSGEANYSKAKIELEAQINDGVFPYKHIIVDEGQDFGRENLDQSNLLDILAFYGKEYEGTSFYLFYDKNQMIQAQKLPDYITQSDSKITLYRNCRNTVRIAKASLKPLCLGANCYEFAPEGEKPVLTYVSNADEAIHRIDNILDSLPKTNSGNTVILTCKTLNSSWLTGRLKTKMGKDIYQAPSGVKAQAYTVRTFKGLEADNVILVDVGPDMFDDGKLDFYVGSSRARSRLFVLANIDSNDAERILAKHFPDAIQKKDKLKMLRLELDWN